MRIFLNISAITLLLAATSFSQTASKPATRPATPAAKPQTTTPHRAPAPAPDPITLWNQVSPTAAAPQLAPAELTPDQIQYVQERLLDRAEADGWGCEDDVPPTDWVKDLTYFQLPLTPTAQAIFIQAGHTCGRSGEHDVNGAMWILLPPAKADGEPLLIATPEDSFNGQLYSVQMMRSHGLPDLVVTWFLNPGESDLTLLRFDGKLYAPVTIAKRLTENGETHITPVPIPKEK